MVKKESPFKIWQSYFGAVVGFIFTLIFVVPLALVGGVEPSTVIIYFVIGIIIGFLIGWGIQSLFKKRNPKKMKKRKKKGFWNWVKVNKEGAIIGGVLSTLSLIFAKTFAPLALPFFIGLLTIGQVICGGSKDYGLFFGPRCSDFQISIVYGIVILIFILIGAFIDSIWRPDK